MSKESKKKKPFYGLRTKKQVIEEYFYTSASMNELSEIHGILGSNTVSDWLRKYSNLRGHLITDAYSKKLMGAVVADDMKATTTLLALKMALKNRQNNDTSNCQRIKANSLLSSF
ncbi:MAG: hypothetical protein AB8H03_17495 [Saprospiraceae bacterium]